MKVKKDLIIMRPSDWEYVKNKLLKDYGPSILISWKCKRELGFTIRNHKALQEIEGDDDEFKGRYYYKPEIHLDFYSEAQQVYFLLKYGNELHNN